MSDGFLSGLRFFAILIMTINFIFGYILGVYSLYYGNFIDALFNGFTAVICILFFVYNWRMGL